MVSRGFTGPPIKLQRVRPFNDIKFFIPVKSTSNFKIFRATSVLSGHKAGIIDLRLRVKRKQLLSYSKDAVLKLWDLNNAVIIQTLSLHFPAFSVLGKEVNQFRNNYLMFFFTYLKSNSSWNSPVK